MRQIERNLIKELKLKMIDEYFENHKNRMKKRTKK